MKLPSRWKGNSWIQRYSIELFLFSFSLATAYFMGWNNTDLIWSFWITSLVVGYLTVFRTTVAPLSLLAKLIVSPEEIKKFRELPITMKLKIAIFVFYSHKFVLYRFLKFSLLRIPSFACLLVANVNAPFGYSRYFGCCKWWRILYLYSDHQDSLNVLLDNCDSKNYL